MFNYFINHYIVSPIINMTKSVQRFLKNNEPFQLRVETKDELERLGNAIQDLVAQSIKGQASQ
jgi:methyl-accepting chemotaxis protein